jgi:hypothetical protein
VSTSVFFAVEALYAGTSEGTFIGSGRRTSPCWPGSRRSNPLWATSALNGCILAFLGEKTLACLEDSLSGGSLGAPRRLGLEFPTPLCLERARCRWRGRETNPRSARGNGSPVWSSQVEGSRAESASPRTGSMSARTRGLFWPAGCRRQRIEEPA